ncbi:MAG: putative RecB family exonuclease [Micromonosporaceae bacterium]|nr:putative RecB family exonuclease [Micromonosporaceae bacterium]
MTVAAVPQTTQPPVAGADPATGRLESIKPTESAATTEPTETTATTEPTESAEPRMPSLSPSRAADFKTCPLLFRFRTIDRLPAQPTPDQARGTLVHAVLERLFDLPAADRTPDGAAALIAPQWERLVAEQPELAVLFAVASAPDDTETAVVNVPGQTGITVGDVPDPAADGPIPAAGLTAAAFLDSATALLAGYFAVEDPRRLEPAQRETLVESIIDDRLVIRGYVDRLDISPAGDLRVVDYKTGGAPREAFEARALFQLKFYALVLWRIHGVVPRVLRLLYLRDAEVCDYSPDRDELLRFERNLLALWQAIERAIETGDFRPQPSRLCGWCSYQAHCPTFGGTPPPYPPPPPPAQPEAPPVPATPQREPVPASATAQPEVAPPNPH